MSFWSIRTKHKALDVSSIPHHYQAQQNGININGVYTTREIARNELRLDKREYPGYYSLRLATVVKVKITVEEIK